MPQVTKKIYPAITYDSLKVQYSIDASGTIDELNSYEYIQGEFDVSSIKTLISAELVVNVTQANKVCYKGFTASDFEAYLRLRCSTLGVSDNTLSLSTGTIKKTVPADGITNIINASSFGFSLSPREMSYSGTKPTSKTQFAYIELAIDSEANKTTYLECTLTEPELKDFTVTGTSIDKNVNCTWTGSDYTSWTVKAKLNGVVKATKTGTTENKCTFVPGDLTESGTYTFEVTVSDGVQNVTSTANAELTKTYPIISTLEPNGVSQLKSSNIKISFTGFYISSYSIAAVQDGVTKWSKSANNTDNSTSFSFVMVSDLFDSGTVSLNLTCTYSNGYYTTETTRKSIFSVYGNPPTPLILSQSTYNTATPTIGFTCSESYVSYQVEVDGTQTSETYGEPNYYAISTPLSNKSYHTFKVRVKNQYKLWSDWASATFYVEYAELEAPTINVYSDSKNNCIVINVESPAQTLFLNHTILRSEDKKTWTIVAKGLSRIDIFKDNSCASNIVYYYKARANDSNMGIKDSDTVSCSCNFEGNVISVPWTENSLRLMFFDSMDSVNKQLSNTTEKTFKTVCGLSLPKVQRSSIKYRSFILNIAFKTKESYEEFMLFENEEVLLFRDQKGLKIYCDMTIASEQYISSYYKVINATFTEVYYKEGDYVEEPDRTFRYSFDEW